VASLAITARQAKERSMPETLQHAVATTPIRPRPSMAHRASRAARIAAAAAFGALTLAAAPLAHAAEPVPPATGGSEPQRLPTSTGEVLLPTPMDVKFHEEWQFASARRAGNLVFVSGVVAGPKPGEKPTPEAYEAGVRRAFGAIERALKAAGLGFEHVAMMNTFHIWKTPHFEGTKQQQFQAFLRAKQDYMKSPHTAWTAVGVTELLPDNGVVEIQVIAAVPDAR
jgi:enamine deaminase RidA (YjgF/YER057c/UK114 family)